MAMANEILKKPQFLSSVPHVQPASLTSIGSTYFWYIEIQNYRDRNIGSLRIEKYL